MRLQVLLYLHQVWKVQLFLLRFIFSFEHDILANPILFDVCIHTQLLIAHHSVASHNSDEATWIFVNIKLLAAIQSGSVKYPQLNHRSTDYEAMQDSARRLTLEHLSSVSAELKQLFFIFILDFTLLELSEGISRRTSAGSSNKRGIVTLTVAYANAER